MRRRSFGAWFAMLVVALFVGGAVPAFADDAPPPPAPSTTEPVISDPAPPTADPSTPTPDPTTPAADYTRRRPTTGHHRRPTRPRRTPPTPETTAPAAVDAPVALVNPAVTVTPSTGLVHPADRHDLRHRLHAERRPSAGPSARTTTRVTATTATPATAGCQHRLLGCVQRTVHGAPHPAHRPTATSTARLHRARATSAPEDHRLRRRPRARHSPSTRTHRCRHRPRSSRVRSPTCTRATRSHCSAMASCRAARLRSRSARNRASRPARCCSTSPPMRPAASSRSSRCTASSPRRRSARPTAPTHPTRVNCAPFRSPTTTSRPTSSSTSIPTVRCRRRRPRSRPTPTSSTSSRSPCRVPDSAPTAVRRSCSARATPRRMSDCTQSSRLRGHECHGHVHHADHRAPGVAPRGRRRRLRRHAGPVLTGEHVVRAHHVRGEERARLRRQRAATAAAVGHRHAPHRPRAGPVGHRHRRELRAVVVRGAHRVPHRHRVPAVLLASVDPAECRPTRPAGSRSSSPSGGACSTSEQLSPRGRGLRGVAGLLLDHRVLLRRSGPWRGRRSTSTRRCRSPFPTRPCHRSSTSPTVASCTCTARGSHRVSVSSSRSASRVRPPTGTPAARPSVRSTCSRPTATASSTRRSACTASSRRRTAGSSSSPPPRRTAPTRWGRASCGCSRSTTRSWSPTSRSASIPPRWRRHRPSPSTPVGPFDDGQQVVVHGAGFTPNAVLGLAQCSSAAANPSGDSCDSGDDGLFTQFSADADGTFTRTVTLHTTGRDRPRARSTAAPPASCVLFAANRADYAVERASTPIEFAAGSPGPRSGWRASRRRVRSRSPVPVVVRPRPRWPGSRCCSSVARSSCSPGEVVGRARPPSRRARRSETV